MQCPRGKFEFKKQCHLCHHTCRDCSGSEPNKCTACGTGEKDFLHSSPFAWHPCSLFPLLSEPVVKVNEISISFATDLQHYHVLILLGFGAQQFVCLFVLKNVRKHIFAWSLHPHSPLYVLNGIHGNRSKRNNN